MCYAIFDLKRRTVTMANSGCRIRCAARRPSASQIELPGVPLGSFAGSTYDEVTYRCRPVIYSCSARTACSKQ